MAQAYERNRVRLDVQNPETDDDAFDDVLLTLAQIGGTLKSEEMGYLQHFGYVCEPRKRLAELFEERHYPK